MMEPNKYQEWILETIDSLRSRKARPDLERICRMVRRRYGSDPDRTREELDKLTQSQAVLKVSYKGSISYRNAAKVLRRSRKNCELTASSVESSKREHLNNRDCAQSFTAPEPEEASLDHNESEIPLNLFRNSACNSETLWCVATEEQGRRALISTTGSIGQQQQQQQQQQQGGRQPHAGHTHSVSSAPSGEIESRGVNFTNKKTHSVPSQSQTLSMKPKLCTANLAQGAASASSLSVASAGHIQSLGRKDIVGYLRHQEGRRSTGEGVVDRDVAQARRWTRCGNVTLGAALEPRGKQLPENDPTQTAGDEGRWQGLNEQIKDIPQSVDKLSGPPVAMATDSEAEDAEIQIASLHWTRGKSCTESTAIPKQSCGDPEIEGASCLLTPTASPIPLSVDEPESFSARSLSPTDWSVSDVVSYFTAAGFPEQAAAFRSQEIDGRSLLLMQRNDVLTGLSIKLGPALKIYEHHVKALQKTQFEEEEL